MIDFSTLKNALYRKFKKLTFTDSYVTIRGKCEALIENVTGVYNCVSVSGTISSVEINNNGVKL